MIHPCVIHHIGQHSLPDISPARQIRALLLSSEANGSTIRSIMKIYIPLMSTPAGQSRSQTSRGLLLGPQVHCCRILSFRTNGAVARQGAQRPLMLGPRGRGARCGR